jgi:YHS domain-containing protein
MGLAVLRNVQGEAKEKLMTLKLSVDPVCGMKITDQNAAPQSIFAGDTYYFCENSCKASFDETPERYAHSNPAAPMK